MFFYCFVIVASFLLAVARYLDKHKCFQQIGKPWVLLEFAFPIFAVIIFGFHITFGFRFFDYVILVGAIAQIWVERTIVTRMSSGKVKKNSKFTRKHA